MNKIKDVFYPLTPSIAQKLRKAKLTAAEWRFWSYLTEIDPWGDKYHELNPLTVMQECDISKPTYYRAKAKFQEMELFDFQEEKVSFRNLTGVSKMRLESQKCNWSLKNETDSIKNETDFIKNETTAESEVNQDDDSRSPQITQTYQDFLDSLSEGERESFLEFGKKKAAQLPRPPGLPLKWIEAHYEELRSQWEKQNGVVHYSKDWENDPRREGWLDKIRSLGFAAFIYENDSLDNERKEFYEWANANKLIWENGP